MNFAELFTRINQQVDPSCSNSERIESYKYLEAYKNETFDVAHLAELCNPKQGPTVFVFGLRCLEHKIKFCWSKASDNEKGEIKQSLLQLCSNIDSLIGNSSTDTVVTSVISQILVHLMKCEWPQNWPDMLDQLFLIGYSGFPQASLILGTLLRFVQDIMDYCYISQNRKRDLCTAVKQNMQALYSLPLGHLSHKFQSKDKSPAAISTSRAALALIAELFRYFNLDAFLNWKSDAPSFDSAGIALLCSCLEDPDLRVAAAEALENVLLFNPDLAGSSVRTRVLEKTHHFLFYLFAPKHTASPSSFHTVCARLIEELSVSKYTEERDAFLNKMANSFARLCVDTVEAHDVLKLDNYGFCSCSQAQKLAPDCHRWASHLFLVLLKFEQFPVKLISVKFADFWMPFFRKSPNPFMDCLEPCFPIIALQWRYALNNVSEFTPDVLEWHNSLTEAERRHQFLLRRQVLLRKCFDALTRVRPALMLQLTLECVRQTVENPIEMKPTDLLRSGYPFLKESHSYVSDWEALYVELHQVLATVAECEEAKKLPTQEINQAVAAMATATLQFMERAQDTWLSDPRIRGSVNLVLIQLVTCLRDAADADLVIAMIRQLFAAITYNPDGVDIPGKTENGFATLYPHLANRAHQPRIVKEMHSKVAAAFYNYSKSNASRIVDFFDALCQELSKLWQSDACGLVPKCIILQVLFYLCSHSDRSWEQQLETLRGTFGFVFAPWMVTSGGSAEESLMVSISSAEDIISAIGLNLGVQVTNEKEMAEQQAALERRVVISRNFETLLAASRTLNDIKDEAQRTYLCSNLLEPVVLPLVRILRAFHLLCDENSQALVHPSLRAAFQPSEATKAAMLGLVEADNEEHSVLRPYQREHFELISVDRIRGFVTFLQEKLYSIFGFLVSSLNEKFYELPLQHIQMIVRDACFACFDKMPYWRFSLAIKCLLKPLIENCPKAKIRDVLLPVVASVLNPIFDYLPICWSRLQSLSEAEKNNRDDFSDELILEDSVRNLTRAAADTVRLLLRFNGREHRGAPAEAREMENVDDDAPTAKHLQLKLGEAGLTWLNCRDDLFWTIFGSQFARAITWPDLQSCQKFTSILNMILDTIRSTDASALPSEVASCLITGVMYALHVNAQASEPHVHVGLINLAVSVYELVGAEVASNQLRPIVLSAIQSTADPTKLRDPLATLLAFENQVFGGGQESERRKRDAFKNLTMSVVGVPLCEKFRENHKLISAPQKAKPAPMSKQPQSNSAKNAAFEDLASLNWF